MAVSSRVIAREVFASALSQRVTSIVTLVLMLGAAATIVVTAGRSEGAEAQVLSKIDAQGTRSLTVFAQGTQDAFNSQLVGNLAQYDSIQQVTGFGPIEDVTAAANPDGTRVGMRPAYGSLGFAELTAIPKIGDQEQVWATADALTKLGMPNGRGTVRTVSGREFIVTRTFTLPDNLAELEPALIVPRGQERGDPLASLVVIATSPQDLPLVTQLVTAALADVPRDGVKIETSQDLADLRAAIGGELTAQNRAVILGAMGAAAAAVLVNVWSLALLRRRDFGRRRALGASRTMITVLVLGQVLMLAVVGAVFGAALGFVALTTQGQPRPEPSFMGAVVVGYTLTVTIAAALPALWAARRDPLTELRVP